jgi:mono/diheme cytochrome c family protein
VSSAASSPAAAGGPASAPAPVPAAAPPAPVEEPVHPSYIAAEGIARTRVPMWVMPVLVLLPFWGFLYLGAFGDRHTEEVLDPLVLGEQVYRAQGCSSCHGAAGEGGVGPPLANGDSVLTFPEEADQVAWIRSGSGPFKGQPYGDPNRPGGQRGPAQGIMPGYPNLSDEEVQAVVAYEREQL